MALTQDPQVMEIMGKSPNAQKAISEMAAHVQEHLAFQYRLEIEKELGVELPTPEESLPEDIEFRISILVAPAAAQLSGKSQKEQQMKQAEEQLKDPVIQMQMQELKIKEQDVQRKAQADMAKIQLDMQKLEQDGRIKTAEIGAKIAETNSKEELESAKIASEEQIEGVKLGIEIAKQTMGDDK